MALSPVDQLNNLTTSRSKKRAIDYETYFGEMELSEGEIEERIALAEDLDDVFEYLFVLYLAMLRTGKKVDRDELVQTLLTRYRDVLYNNGLDIDERYPGMYGISQRSSESIVDTTIAYGAADGWYTSEDRAMFLAENEANSIANYEDLMDAIDAGYTEKTWVTMADRKVRDTHRELEGVTISIFEPFDVGGYQMMMPKDDSMGAGPEEIVNCRCSVMFGGFDSKIIADREDEAEDSYSRLPMAAGFKQPPFANEIDGSSESTTDYFGGPNGKVITADLSGWIGNNRHDELMAIGTNPLYLRLINELYRSKSFIGDGGTADARRFEKATGLGLGRNGNTHAQKVQDMIRYIQTKVLRENLTQDEEQTVLWILSELQSV